MAQPVLDRAPAVTTHLHHPAARAAGHRAAPPVAIPAPSPTDPRETPVPDRRARPEQRVSAGPVAVDRAGEPDVHVRTPAYGVRTVEARPGSESAIAVAARTADVIRLEFSVAVPSVGALSRVAALVDEALAEQGRDRSEVRVLLDLEVVLADDERTARRKRSQLEHLDALAGLTWSPADTRVVTTADRLVAEARELAIRAGVDGVVLHPLSGGAAVEDVLRALVP
jgi:alkanesulfonate monooxygenase SsuD/methylene tetrahydromethanopterin reductase-like flavin-dependent oxidoreductase (luciferase family)